MDSNTTVETKDGRTTVTTGSVRSVFPAGNVDAAVRQIGLVQGMVERLQAEVAELRTRWETASDSEGITAEYHGTKINDAVEGENDET